MCVCILFLYASMLVLIIIRIPGRAMVDLRFSCVHSVLNNRGSSALGRPETLLWFSDWHINDLMIPLTGTGPGQQTHQCELWKEEKFKHSVCSGILSEYFLLYHCKGSQKDWNYEKQRD